MFWSRRVVFAYYNSNVKQQSTTVNRRCNHGVLTIQPWGFWTKSAMVWQRKCGVLGVQVGWFWQLNGVAEDAEQPTFASQLPQKTKPDISINLYHSHNQQYATITFLQQNIRPAACSKRFLYCFWR